MHRHSRIAGFTLIEMVAVVVIISLFAAIVIVKVDSVLPSCRIRQTARQVGLNIQAAKSCARREGGEMEIVYDFDNNRCRVIPAGGDEDADPDEIALNTCDLPDGIRLQDVELSDLTIIETGRLRISVSTAGLINPHYVHIVSDEGRTFTIMVRMMSGIVEYREGRFKPEHSYAQAD